MSCSNVRVFLGRASASASAAPAIKVPVIPGRLKCSSGFEFVMQCAAHECVCRNCVYCITYCI